MTTATDADLARLIQAMNPADPASVAAVKDHLAVLEAQTEAAKVSPFAPAAFPELPSIPGVTLAAAACGVRYKARLDVMLAMIAPGGAMAGVFTRSATRSAPVLWCQEKLAAHQQIGGGGPMAIVVNAGNSNAFTGRHGDDSVRATVEAAAAATGASQEDIYLASTGVIGEPLPHDRIVAKLADLNAALAPDAYAEAARAIMTTDTFPKGAFRAVEVDGVPVRLAGFAKGSGMIAPDMATMLAFVFTDANVAPSALQAMLAEANEASFNAVTVDGDTSTSDTLLLAASRKADHAAIESAADPRAAPLQAGLTDLLRDLAHQVVKDGEGAQKFVEIRVTGAADSADARKAALAIANSPLVKTAIAGEDPNWGRIVMAVGKSGAAADRDRLAIHFGDVLVAERGWVADSYREEAGAAYMKNSELVVIVDLGVGAAESVVWTCDLTHAYIRINADYRS